jgi:hypothetical protein
MSTSYLVSIRLLDSTASCKLLSFLDAYSGYHKISLAIDYEEKQRSSPHLESSRTQS